MRRRELIRLLGGAAPPRQGIKRSEIAERESAGGQSSSCSELSNRLCQQAELMVDQCTDFFGGTLLRIIDSDQ
jgi:hypothetical protein